MSILRRSKWRYQTGSSGGANFEFVIATGGEIILIDPAGQSTDFYYGGVGGGLGMGFHLSKIKIPKFKLPDIKAPRIAGHKIGAARSLESFDSAGVVFMTAAFHGAELSRSDLQGAIVCIDAGAGLAYGKAGTAMLLGINSAKLAMGLSNSAQYWMALEAIAEAPAVLLAGGTTVGLIAGGGLGMWVGYLH